MMTKMVAKYIDRGFSFPVVLEHVPIVQVCFIRHHFAMTLQAFAARFGVTHVAVLKWEQRGNKPTGMM